MQAATVVDVLKRQCERLGINIVTDCEIKRVEHFGDNFFVYTSKGVFESATLILATGGKAQKALGSDGSGYEIAKSLGHAITELSPALVQLKSSNKNCRSLKGTRTKCLVKIETNGEIIGEEYGELLFTDYGLSGIVVMNLSTLINDKRLQSGQDKTVAIIDFVPEMSEDDLKQHLENFGPFAGVITLMLNSIGFIGKLLAEDIENISSEQIEAIKATGANWFQVVAYGVWPQISTRFIGLSIYRADISFRQSTVIGIVGAGGIGTVLNTAMNRYDYNTAGAILLVIIVLVLVTEYISSNVRRRIV